MTLGVNIVEKYSGASLNDNGKKYGVLLDDTTSEIKSKVFVNTDNFYNETVPYYPNLVKLEIKRNDDYILITDSNSLLFFYDTLPSKPIVYVTSIFNIINEPSYKDFNLEPYELYTKLKQDDIMISDLYDALVSDFVELTLDDLTAVIKMKMFNFNRTSDMSTISSQENANLMEDIKAFFNAIKTRFESESKVYKKENTSLTKFYERVYKYDHAPYYDTFGTQLYPNFIYTTLNFTLRQNDYSATDKFVKLYQIFNMIELSDKIPLVAFNDSPRRTPKIKIYNRLIDTLNENSIRSWILNEKKKMQKASYKKIRGLVIKYRLQDVITTKPQNKYITINISESGFIKVRVNFEEDDDQRSIKDIMKMIYSGVDEVIDILNELHGVFTQSKRLQKVDNMISDLVSVNAVLETNKRINRTKFKKILNKIEGSRTFDSKDIKDMISMYYKRFGKRDVDDDVERLGITVNVKDNPYKMNSSTIVIYGGYNLNQLKVIVDNIMVLSEISSELKKNIFEDSDDEDEEVVLKERKQNIKKVREMGGKMSSITCQKKRQPKIDNETNIQDPELVMVYNGNKYICEGTGKHKYPGLSGDIPCCFEYPGKGMESIVSANILEIKVQPSNFTVDVIDGSTTFKTFVIKVTSEDVEKLDLSRSRYFYINDDPNSELPLVHIHSPELISTIERDEVNDKNESIWLVEVPLYQLISKPKKDKCLHIPHLHKRTKDNINAPCEHHDKEQTFGYNIKSYPCCFENKPPKYRLRKDDKTTVTKQHIITTDKLLGYKRQGVLQPGLNILLNEIIKTDSAAFLRWGVNQNQLSFFNCIVESVSNNDDIKIDSTYALKRYLTNHLNQNPADFLRLNNGNISLKYGTLDEYLSAINSESVIHWSDIIDLVQIALKCNILIIDIPYVESLSKTTFTYEDMRLVCNLNIQQDRANPFLLLVKKQNAFEIIISNSSARWNKSSGKMQILDNPPVINFVFKYDPLKNASENVVNFFVDYYAKSCIKENDFPEKYPYEELYTIDYIIKILKDSDHKVWFQLVNAFNKVNLVVTKLGLVVPVKETGVIDKIPTISFEEFVFKQKAISLQRFVELLDEFNLINIEPKMKILGVTVRNGFYTGILTNFGQTIPVKQTEVDSSITLPILESKYYTDVDSALASKKDQNKESMWNSDVIDQKTRVYDVKKQIGERLVNDMITRETIIKINKTPDLTKLEKIGLIKDILRKYTDPNQTDLDFILDNISNEVINDNVENLLLHNLVTSEVFNPDEITKRSTESVWLNLDDIKKWFRKFKV
jgi:hypothetical protein